MMFESSDLASLDISHERRKTVAVEGMQVFVGVLLPLCRLGKTFRAAQLLYFMQVGSEGGKKNLSRYVNV